jgi:dipeptidyl aminopeptidase/acylaminoacyl peptidase
MKVGKRAASEPANAELVHPTSIRLGTARLLCALMCVSVLAVGTSSNATAQKGPRPMTIVDLINMRPIRGPRLSPDGRQLLFVRGDVDWKENRTIGHIWRFDIESGEAMQLTYGERPESSPLWSPDGTHIAFVTRRGDEEHNQIYLMRTAGGEARRLTDHATSVGGLEWSHDGQYIYFLARDEKSEQQQAREEKKDDVYAFDEDYQQRHLWRVAVESGEGKRITEGDFSISSYLPSQDGSTIVLTRAPTPLLDDWDESEVYVMSASGDDPVRITDNLVPEGSVELSPDGSQVLFVTSANEEFDFYYNDNLFVAPAAGGPSKLLMPDFDYEVFGATWSADGRYIYFSANTGVRQDLFRVEVASERYERLTEGDHSVVGWSYYAKLGRHVFQISERTNAGDVWMLEERRGARPEQVTHFFDDLEEKYLLPRQEAVQWAGADGVTVEGLLFYPLDYEEGKRYPLIVQTHGGPASSDRFAFGSSGDYVQVLAALGYMVLQPNYRGSTGYGDDFLRDMVGHYFKNAHLDVMAGVDYLIEQGLVDGDRMGKMGWSAGGHMTNKIITFTDRFKAACSGAGAANWISMYGQSDVRIYRTPWFGGTPWQENAPIDVYWENSPLSDVAQVTTPTIFLVGQNDARVPMPQSVEMHRALKANGVPTHLYVAPRAGHGWGGTSSWTGSSAGSWSATTSGRRPPAMRRRRRKRK